MAVVGWSRVCLREHHVSDVVLGGALGAAFGLLLGVAARVASGKPTPRLFLAGSGGLKDWLWRRARRRFSETHVRVNAPRPKPEGPSDGEDSGPVGTVGQ